MKYYREPSYYAGSSWRGTLAMDGGGALMNQGDSWSRSASKHYGTSKKRPLHEAERCFTT